MKLDNSEKAAKYLFDMHYGHGLKYEDLDIFGKLSLMASFIKWFE